MTMVIITETLFFDKIFTRLGHHSQDQTLLWGRWPTWNSWFGLFCKALNSEVLQAAYFTDMSPSGFMKTLRGNTSNQLVRNMRWDVVSQLLKAVRIAKKTVLNEITDNLYCMNKLMWKNSILRYFHYLHISVIIEVHVLTSVELEVTFYSYDNS